MRQRSLTKSARKKVSVLLAGHVRNYPMGMRITIDDRQAETPFPLSPHPICPSALRHLDLVLIRYLFPNRTYKAATKSELYSVSRNFRCSIKQWFVSCCVYGELYAQLLFQHFRARKVCTVVHKSHDPCFHVFLMKARVITFVAYCTCRLQYCICW